MRGSFAPLKDDNEKRDDTEKREAGFRPALRAVLRTELLHAVGWVPRALQLANVKYLAGVVGVMRANVGDSRRRGVEFGFVGVLDPILKPGHDAVEAFDCRCPGGRVECVEGLVVVAVEGWRLFAAELGERTLVPEGEVDGELADGVLAGFACGLGWNPLGLLGREAGDGGVEGDEPLGFVMDGVELREQDGAQGGRGFLGWSLGEGERSQQEEQREKQSAAHVRNCIVRRKHGSEVVTSGCFLCS